MLGREFCQRQGVGVGPGGVGACNGFGLRLLGKKCCDTDDTLGRVLRLGDGLLTALRNPLQCCEGREPLKPRESEGSNGFMDRGLQLELISYLLFRYFTEDSVRLLTRLRCRDRSVHSLGSLTQSGRLSNGHDNVDGPES